MRLTALLIIATLACPAKAGSSNVPPGFENLLEKQTTLLDVYFGGQFLLSTLTEFNTDEIQFVDPRAVAERIPGLIDRDEVIAALDGVLPANAQLRCYTRNQTNCGILEPDVAGIIFDEDRFRVDIFVSSEYLTLQAIPRQAFLPESDAGWSFLQNFGTAFAGNDDDAFDTMSLNAASLLAFEETRFLLSTSYSNVSDWTADDILIRRDFQGRENQLGYFRTVNDASLRFIPEVSLRGIRTASTLDTRTDLNASSGRELSVFLVNRSRVSLFKDGRLVSSANYDAGNQMLDTARLPNGAYPITIRIEDASGRSRDEQRFYVKSSRFPPRDQALWGLELGEQVLRNSEDFIPESEGVFFGRFSASKRVTDSLAVNGGMAVRDRDGILELGIDRLNPYFDIQLNAAVSNDNGYGLSADLRTRWEDITFGANYRETWADDELRDKLDSGDLTPGEATDLTAELYWFGQDSRQWSANLAWYLWGGTVNVDARNTQITSQENIEEYSISYFYPIIRTGRYRLDLDMEASEFNDSTQVLLSLQFRWDQENFTHSAISQYQHRDFNNGRTDDDLEFELGTNWRDQSVDARDLTLNARVSHRADYDDATAGMRWKGAYGELNAEARHESRDSASQTSYTGGYYSSFAMTQGGLAVGGEEQSRSGIMIDLVGEGLDNTWFDVMVNGSKRGVARVGTRNLVTVQPFNTYEVEIIPRGEGFVSFDQRNEKVTLYPGNVATLTWDVSPVNLLFGRLLDSAGTPVANAILRGAAGLAMTDENGYFQAELKSSVHSLQAETRTSYCDFELPDYTTTNGIALLGTVSCEAKPKFP